MVMRYYWGLAIGHTYAHPKAHPQTSSYHSTRQGTDTDPANNDIVEDVFTDPIPLCDTGNEEMHPERYDVGDEELLLERRDENVWDDPGDEYSDQDVEQDYAYDELFADVQ
jgi:hypothetical protein